MEYLDFLKTKNISHNPCGFDIDKSELNANLFEWQKITTKWAIKKGKSALFEDAGLGKTIQFLSWSEIISKKTGGNIIIFSPLAVSHQTIREGKKFGVDVNYCKSQALVSQSTMVLIIF